MTLITVIFTSAIITLMSLSFVRFSCTTRQVLYSTIAREANLIQEQQFNTETELTKLHHQELMEQTERGMKRDATGVSLLLTSVQNAVKDAMNENKRKIIEDIFNTFTNEEALRLLVRAEVARYHSDKTKTNEKGREQKDVCNKEK